MFCRNCGSQLKEGAEFCPSCGTKAPVQTQAQNQVQQSQVVNQPAPVYSNQATVKNFGGSKGLIIGLSIGIGVLVIIIVCVVLFMFFGNKDTKKESVKVEVTNEQSDDKKSDDSANKKKDDDYILLDSDKRYMTDAQLQGLSTYDLYLARNEIYARHGRDFKKDDLKQYFGAKSWYHVQYTPEYFDSHTNTLLNDYERKNAEKMLAIEKSRNSPYLAP